MNCLHGWRIGDLRCWACALDRKALADRHGEPIPRGSEPLSAKEGELVARLHAKTKCPHGVRPSRCIACRADAPSPAARTVCPHFAHLTRVQCAICLGHPATPPPQECAALRAELVALGARIPDAAPTFKAIVPLVFPPRPGPTQGPCPECGRTIVLEGQRASHAVPECAWFAELLATPLEER